MQGTHIQKCVVGECGYNKDMHCHAIAITVGGVGDHNCDTFCMCGDKGGVPSATGMVGACKVTDCSNNCDLECSSPNVSIGREQGYVCCMNFEKRM